jgi:hypothetical protein
MERLALEQRLETIVVLVTYHVHAMKARDLKWSVSNFSTEREQRPRVSYKMKPCVNVDVTDLV